MDGDHTIEKTAEVQEEVIKQVYFACQANGVFLEGTLLKPSMTVNGADCPTKADPMKVAEMTIRTMVRSCICSWNSFLIRRVKRRSCFCLSK